VHKPIKPNRWLDRIKGISLRFSFAYYRVLVRPPRVFLPLIIPSFVSR
jgi:hypothetical protein